MADKKEKTETGNGNVATVAKKEATLAEFVRSPYMMDQIKVALPKILTPERFLRVAHTALNKTPKLQQCTRASIAMSLLKCAELGLEPDGRCAHLVPFKDQCTVIIDYKGKVELAMRSGTVANIHADKICDNDVFKYNKGVVEEHIIDFRKERGAAYAYYCLIRFKDGSEKAEVMTLAEVDAIRKRSKTPNDGPWVTDYDEMGKKTVFHRASKWITLSPKFAKAQELEEEEMADNKVAASAMFALPDANEVQPAETPAEGLAAAAEPEGELPLGK
jgi:recombination protein RecT